MKNLLLKSVLAFSMAIPAVAQHRFDPRDRREDLVERTQDLARQVEDSLRRDAYRLSEWQLRDIYNSLESVQSIIRNDRQPNPPHRPNPPPYEPVVINFRGKIELAEYNFNANNLFDLNSQCMAFVSANRLSSVDDITVSVDYRPIETLKNRSSYWKGSVQVCQQILNIAAKAGLKVRSGYTVVSGSIENAEFVFEVNGRSDLYSQCENLVKNSNITSADDMIVSVNFTKEKVLRNGSSYWKGATEICNQLINNSF